MSAASWRFACALCATAYRHTHNEYCSACGGPVLADRVPTEAGGTAPLATPGPGIWRYAAHLPLSGDASWLSLGEAMTPLVPSPALAERVGAGQVWLKLDHLNATGSFKDRATAAGVAHALAVGANGVVCASSGNAAASVSAYAARARLRAVIVVPEQVPVAKLAGCLAHGALPLAVPGDYSASFALARELARELDLMNLATTYINPVAVAALRSVAFDLAEQAGAGVDWVHVPTGSGPLVHGVTQGFRDLVGLGHAPRVPRVVVAQAAGCAPIVHAYDRGAEHVAAWPAVTSSVSGINDPLRGYAADGTVTLREVRSTGGRAVAVEDTAIDEARTLLGHELGIYVEPAAAASVASLLATAGAYGTDDVVVCLLTGHGLKIAGAGAPEVPVVDGIEAAVSALRRADWAERSGYQA